MEYGPRRRMMGKIGDVCLGNERKTSSSLLGQKLNQKKKKEEEDVEERKRFWNREHGSWGTHKMCKASRSL